MSSHWPLSNEQPMPTTSVRYRLLTTTRLRRVREGNIQHVRPLAPAPSFHLSHTSSCGSRLIQYNGSGKYAYTHKQSTTVIKCTAICLQQTPVLLFITRGQEQNRLPKRLNNLTQAKDSVEYWRSYNCPQSNVWKSVQPFWRFNP